MQKPLATRLEQLIWPLRPGRELLPGVTYQGAAWNGDVVLHFSPPPGLAWEGPIKVGLASREQDGGGLFQTRYFRVTCVGPHVLPPQVVTVVKAVAGLIGQAERRFRRVEYPELAAAVRRWEEPVIRGGVGEVRLIIRCNEACPFCHTDERAENVVFDLNAYRRTLERFRAQGVHTLVLSGGEPTLRPDLEDFVGLGASFGFPEIILQTNATRLGQNELAARLKKAGLHRALVSLHSANAHTSAQMTGFAGSLPATLAGVDAALAAGIVVSVNMVVTPHNLGDVAGFPQFLQERFGGRIEHLLLSVASPNFNGWRESAFFPNPADVGQPLSAALRRAAALGLPAFVPNLCGVPACVLDEDVRQQHVDNAFSTEGYLHQIGRVFPLACAGCGFREGCTGVWGKAVTRFGGDWVRPITAPSPPPVQASPATNGKNAG